MRYRPASPPRTPLPRTPLARFQELDRGRSSAAVPLVNERIFTNEGLSTPHPGAEPPGEGLSLEGHFNRKLHDALAGRDRRRTERGEPGEGTRRAVEAVVRAVLGDHVVLVQ